MQVNYFILSFQSKNSTKLSICYVFGMYISLGFSFPAAAGVDA